MDIQYLRPRHGMSRFLIHFYFPELTTRLEYRETALEFSENISVFLTCNLHVHTSIMEILG